MTPLSELLLAKPVGPAVPAKPDESHFTQKIEVKGDQAEVVYNVPEGEERPHNNAALIAHDLDPTEWEMTGFRSSEWTVPNGQVGTSHRVTFRRIHTATAPERPNLDELFDQINVHVPNPSRATGDHGYIVALGDMQFGKIDGDGVEGTLRRTIAYLNRAADLLPIYRNRFDIGHVHIAWLGDHVEGFVSQGGANVFRTVLTMNEQIRLTRRVMLHALRLFANEAEHVSMAAIPGNHGEPQRLAGKGVTRYDDSHDTESLIAVADAAELHPEAFGHVKFYVPDTDEMVVVVPVAGTNVAHVHGHQWRGGKYFDWWKGQAFNPASPMGKADVLLAGHGHHEHIESDGKRLFIQVPALESDSTWYRHNTGTTGNPGLIVAITNNGVMSPLEVVR